VNDQSRDGSAIDLYCTPSLTPRTLKAAAGLGELKMIRAV
jgi:hypothetical protein